MEHTASPHIIALVGLPGAGKTHFAASFADAFPAPFIDGQALRIMARNADDAQLFALSMLKEVMKTKKTAVYGGLVDRRTDREALVRLARQHGYRVLFVWVQTDQKISQARALKHMSPEEYAQRVKRFSPPHESEPYIVISGHRATNTQMRTLLRHLSEQQSQEAAKQPIVQRPANRIRIG